MTSNSAIAASVTILWLTQDVHEGELLSKAWFDISPYRCVETRQVVPLKAHVRKPVSQRWRLLNTVLLDAILETCDDPSFCSLTVCRLMGVLLDRAPDSSDYNYDPAVWFAQLHHCHCLLGSLPRNHPPPSMKWAVTCAHWMAPSQD